MASSDEVTNMASILAVLWNEEELIIKPLQSAAANDVGAIECGKIVSRINKALFDYQIGDKTNTSVISSVFSQRIILTNPGTKQVVLEFYHNRLPLFCQVCCKQEVQCRSTVSEDSLAIGSVRQGVAFAKVWYDIYDSEREHVASVLLRKSHLRGKIQHRVPEFEIISSDGTTNVGRINPFSMDLERSEYGQAVAVKIPHDMKVETKATLLMATLILKSRLV